MSFSVYNWEYDSALIKGSALLVLFRKPESDDALDYKTRLGSSGEFL